jgi:hypothetical protein
MFVCAILALIVAVGLAALKGDRPERQAAAAIVVAWVATLVFEDDARRLGAEATIGALSFIDVSLLLALILIAFQSRRAWPVLAAGFQAIAMIPHLTRLFKLRVGSGIFGPALDIASIGVALSLAVGTIIAWRERESLKSMAEALKEPLFRF